MLALVRRVAERVTAFLAALVTARLWHRGAASTTADEAGQAPSAWLGYESAQPHLQRMGRPSGRP